ncbi:MATE family efflux transporter [Permianibacter sp. IMCC34836]|uniref:MATE family efflux transporter n=1 Tax=Permianibacter fluminis TaxID=2738515 RepID=UPI001556FD87|nr:MATE family efflux transporter [Permianibacter fluminis]NQD35866.1 MATE family efflux transporter [Permianibacter fluminis]
MKDLTQGSITRHILIMAAPITIGMLVQTLYFLVDLYFVGQLGGSALAGVSTAGNVMFLIMALTQMLGVGSMALIAQAVGRKDQDDANLIFNQSLLMSLLCGGLTLLAAYTLTPSYLQALGADAATREQGLQYLYWFAPGLALQFALNAMGSALRGTGIVKPTMLVHMLTLLINIVLAPVLIAGWGTGIALGVAGAGLASSIAVAAGVLLLARYFAKQEKYVGYHRHLLRPQWQVWKRILNIGLPSGGEFAFMFVYMAIIYALISSFGSSAMAGFGIGSRVMQAIFMPGMAIAFSVGPIAGQNVGAGNTARVREVIRTALMIESLLMLVLTVLCQLQPHWLVQAFSNDAEVSAVASQFLQIISFNFVAAGIVMTCSGVFQGLGNTWPALLSTGTRLLSFVLPALLLARQPGFTLTQVWYLSVAANTLQALTSLLLLRWQLRRPRLPVSTPASVAA